MTYVVTKPCEGCKHTDCVVVCPCDCFHEGEDMLVINPLDCIDCGACQPECPVEAIYVDDEVPAEWTSYIEHNEKMSQILSLITERRRPE